MRTFKINGVIVSSLVQLSTSFFVPIAEDRQKNLLTPLQNNNIQSISSSLFAKNSNDDIDAEYESMFKLDEKDEMKALRSKLVSESIAPWRGLRLFLYGSAASGAFVGGLITLSGVAAAMNGLRGEDFDMNTEYLNLAIDFGAVAVLGIFFKVDFDKGQELSTKVEDKLQRKKQQSKTVEKMRQREQDLLLKLKLDIQVSTDGGRVEAPIASIQDGAKQHVIIIAGGRKAIKDALLGANLLKLDFAMSNILVVPYVLNDKERDIRPDGRSGFGDDSRPVWETQPYVARAVDEDGEWNDYINLELDDALVQGSNEKAKLIDEGIVIVLANNGKVVRRGVGKVPWRQMVEELEEAVKSEEKIVKDDVFL